MRMSKTFVILFTATISLIGIGAFVILHPKQQIGYCINNGRPFPPETIAEWNREGVIIRSILPDYSSFSNVVAVLGSDYTAVTNGESYWADFRCILPGDTNVSYLTFQVHDGKASWTPGMHIHFPPHKTSETSH